MSPSVTPNLYVSVTDDNHSSLTPRLDIQVNDVPNRFSEFFRTSVPIFLRPLPHRKLGLSPLVIVSLRTFETRTFLRTTSDFGGWGESSSEVGNEPVRVPSLRVKKGEPSRGREHPDDTDLLVEKRVSRFSTHGGSG